MDQTLLTNEKQGKTSTPANTIKLPSFACTGRIWLFQRKNGGALKTFETGRAPSLSIW
jgi:hypothetical protein